MDVHPIPVMPILMPQFQANYTMYSIRSRSHTRVLVIVVVVVALRLAAVAISYDEGVSKQIVRFSCYRRSLPKQVHHSLISSSSSAHSPAACEKIRNFEIY